jgi:hypothetical protein
MEWNGIQQKDARSITRFSRAKSDQKWGENVSNVPLSSAFCELYEIPNSHWVLDGSGGSECLQWTQSKRHVLLSCINSVPGNRDRSLTKRRNMLIIFVPTYEWTLQRWFCLIYFRPPNRLGPQATEKVRIWVYISDFFQWICEDSSLKERGMDDVWPALVLIHAFDQPAYFLFRNVRLSNWEWTESILVMWFRASGLKRTDHTSQCILPIAVW